MIFFTKWSYRTCLYSHKQTFFIPPYWALRTVCSCGSCHKALISTMLYCRATTAARACVVLFESNCKFWAYCKIFTTTPPAFQFFAVFDALCKIGRFFPCTPGAKEFGTTWYYSMGWNTKGWVKKCNSNIIAL